MDKIAKYPKIHAHQLRALMTVSVRQLMRHLPHVNVHRNIKARFVNLSMNRVIRKTAKMVQIVMRLMRKLFVNVCLVFRASCVRRGYQLIFVLVRHALRMQLVLIKMIIMSASVRKELWERGVSCSRVTMVHVLRTLFVITLNWPGLLRTAFCK